MPNDKHIADRFADIAALMADAKMWAKFDPRLDAHLAGYLCVLLTGAIEDAIERMVSLRVGSLGDSQVENYMIKVIAQRFRNFFIGLAYGTEVSRRAQNRTISSTSRILGSGTCLPNT